MEEAVNAAIDQSIAEPTRRRYAAAWKKYEEWCKQLGETPLPISEDKATAYVVTLARGGLKCGSIKYHLAGIRMAQMKAGMATPSWNTGGRLAQVRKGLARMEAVDKKDSLRREPVKWLHMKAMLATWKDKGDRGKMLWAAACMCFFGCLRAGEALTPEGVKFEAGAHLTWKDVQVEDATSPRWIRVVIKESKTDRLRKGATAVLQRTDLDVCPVRAVLEFMAVRGPGKGPFFSDGEGKGLTRRELVAEVRKALTDLRIPAEGISGHSFRIGAATAAAECGASDEEVKALGRWRSREYKGYIRVYGGKQAASAKKWADTIRTEVPEKD